MRLIPPLLFILPTSWASSRSSSWQIQGNYVGVCSIHLDNALDYSPRFFFDTKILRLLFDIYDTLRAWRRKQSARQA